MFFILIIKSTRRHKTFPLKIDVNHALKIELNTKLSAAVSLINHWSRPNFTHHEVKLTL